MKLKDLFNSQRKNELVQELKNDFKPILEKVTVPVTTYAKKNPRTTFFLMIAIVIANIGISIFFMDAFKSKDVTSVLEFPDNKYGSNKVDVPNIEVSSDSYRIEKIRKLKAIKDTLNYLISLKQMSYQDTLTFVRVMDEFQKITSGSTGLPPVSLDDLRKAGTPSAIDTTIYK